MLGCALPQSSLVAEALRAIEAYRGCSTHCPTRVCLLVFLTMRQVTGFGKEGPRGYAPFSSCHIESVLSA